MHGCDRLPPSASFTYRVKGSKRMRLIRLIRYLRSLRLSESIEFAYDEWRNECAAVRIAYRQWVRAHALDERSAFDAYTRALDREERAAIRYAQLVRRAGRSAETRLALQLARIHTGHGLL